VFTFQKDKKWRSAEEKPEFEGRSEAVKKRISEDVSDSSASKHFKSTDLAVEGVEETS
jgi:hypothetical protein